MPLALAGHLLDRLQAAANRPVVPPFEVNLRPRFDLAVPKAAEHLLQRPGAGGLKVEALDGIKSLNADRSRQGCDPIQIRIGVHSGTVVQGDIGGANRKDRTIIGDAVNTASRIEKLCPKDSLLLSEATYARLSNTDGLTLLQKMPIRGKEEMLSLFTFNV